MIKLYDSNKVAVIADLHFGVHSNSELWHKITLEYGQWLRQELLKNNIKDLIVLGDIFNDREEIGVLTLSVAEQFFRIFNDSVNPFNVILLAGNHDNYFRDNSDVNSISIFKGWNNVTVVDTLEYLVTQAGRSLAFLPWGSKLEKVSDNVTVLFGHLEINTFHKTGISLCENGIDSTALLKKSDLIMSGHFHLREERNYNKGRIIYVGCPYPQNWNDADTKKGYYILDTLNLTTTFVENTISPRYYRINFSDFFDSSKLANIKKMIPNNFIKIQLDKEIEFDKFEKVMTTLSLMNPLQLSSDFANDNKPTVNENYEGIHLETKTMLAEFIQALEIEKIKDKVLKEMEHIYNKSITKVKIESE